MTSKMTTTVGGETGGGIVKMIMITLERDQRRTSNRQLIVSQ